MKTNKKVWILEGNTTTIFVWKFQGDTHHPGLFM